MKYVPELSDGQRVRFHLKNVSVKEFEVNDEFNLVDYDGQTCEVVCLATANAGSNDKPDKSFEYYDIRFSDGVVLAAISGHHLEKIS
jgi:hypothetical protein